MKHGLVLFTILFVLFCLKLSGSEIQKGMILCSADYPVQTGFKLVGFKNLKRSYEGEFSINENIILWASYHPTYRDFTFAIKRVIDEYENTTTLLLSSSLLVPGETWKLTIPLGSEEQDRSVHITCRVHWG